MKLFQTFLQDEATDEINYNYDDHKDDDDDFAHKDDDDDVWISRFT